jgi:hypothetical protein
MDAHGRTDEIIDDVLEFPESYSWYIVQDAHRMRQARQQQHSPCAPATPTLHVRSDINEKIAEIERLISSYEDSVVKFIGKMSNTQYCDRRKILAAAARVLLETYTSVCDDESFCRLSQIDLQLSLYMHGLRDYWTANRLEWDAVRH